MLFSDNYFNRYPSFPAFYPEMPDKNTGIIVVIPCYDDESVFETLQSLELANKTETFIEVIVVLNSGEQTSEEIKIRNRQIFEKLKNRKKENYYKNFALLPILLENIPRKKAGVGFARKTGMDEALRRFSLLDKSAGLIVSLDADSIVSKDYFQLIESAGAFQAKTDGFIFQFQHDFDTLKYSSEIIEACKLYETYLRYYRLALKFASFPFAYHTIGSCFAVRVEAYAKTGGMSTRQGGEDFYFIQKLAKMARVSQMKQIMVYPSPRISDKVPFGTGPSVRKIIETGGYKVYNFGLFLILKDFFACFDNFYDSNNLYNVPDEIIAYLGEKELRKIIEECRKNSRSKNAFIKRMFTNFDAFFVVKFLNSFDQDSCFPPMEIHDAATRFLQTIAVEHKYDHLYEIIKNTDINDDFICSSTA